MDILFIATTIRYLSPQFQSGRMPMTGTIWVIYDAAEINMIQSACDHHKHH